MKWYKKKILYKKINFLFNIENYKIIKIVKDSRNILCLKKLSTKFRENIIK